MAKQEELEAKKYQVEQEQKAAWAELEAEESKPGLVKLVRGGRFKDAQRHLGKVRHQWVQVTQEVEAVSMQLRDYQQVVATAPTVEQLGEQFSEVGLGGFSQGAAIATQVLRQEPDRVDFVANLSGFVDPGVVDGDAALAQRKPPVFYARGSADQVVAPYLLEYTHQWLPQHADLTAPVYQGMGHSISSHTLRDLRAFIDERYAD